MASEATILKRIRTAVDLRDGQCRVARNLTAGMGPCWGPSQLAHFGRKRRCFTRNQPAEERHQVQWCLNLCAGHHRAYDEHRLQIIPLTPEVCDGRLVFERLGRRFEEL